MIVINESGYNAEIDPEVIKKELVHLDQKFKELDWNVRNLHNCVKEQLE